MNRLKDVIIFLTGAIIGSLITYNIKLFNTYGFLASLGIAFAMIFAVAQWIRTSYDGVLKITEDEKRILHSIELNIDIEDIPNKKDILLKVEDNREELF